MATKAQWNDCYEKAANEEPVFTLRAQDVSADLVVELWALINSEMQTRVGAGQFVDEILEDLRCQLFDLFVPARIPTVGTASPKLVAAWQVAKLMRAWPARKVAD